MRGEIQDRIITKKDIFDIITPYDIYQYYVGGFVPNRVMNNPFRSDKSASFIIGTKPGFWSHFDFADSKWRGDSLGLVEQIHDCNYNEALEIIDRDFKLGLTGDRKKVVKSEKVKWDQPEEEHIFTPPILQIVTRKFNKEELKYWSEYYTSEDELKANAIYAVSKVYRNRRLLGASDYMTFGYWYEELKSWKLYRPHAPKRTKETPPRNYKWDSTVVYNYCDGLDNLQQCKYAYLTKSRKDRIILSRILGTKCIADVQAEHPHCISKETIDRFKENSEYQIAIFDNDEQGKRSSWWLTNEYGFKHANVPDIYSIHGITDFADLCKKYGDKFVHDYFISKHLI